MKPSLKLSYWRQYEAAENTERQRLSILNGPVPKNDPAITAPTKVRVLRASFCINGKPVIEGSVITIPRCDALGLQVTGKIEFIE